MALKRSVIEGNILYTEVTGVFSSDDAIEALNALPEYFSEGEIYEVLFIANGTRGAFNSHEEHVQVVIVQSMVLAKAKGGAIALVSEEDLFFGLFRSAETQLENESINAEIKSFRSLDVAINWIKETRDKSKKRI